MSTLTLVIVIVFIIGYACIALESVIKVNKAAIALLMFIACWTLFMIDPNAYLILESGEDIIRKATEIQIVRMPRWAERTPPAPAPRAKTKMIPKK